MQRDLYASLIKKRHLPRIAVNILQLDGRVTHEALMADVFFGYRARRIVLMTHTAGQDPRLPALPADIVIPSFEVLAQIHQPHFQYRLLPLICYDLEAFAAMQALCASAGSPFTLQDRLEPQEFTYRFPVSASTVGGATTQGHKAHISAFFDKYLSEAERQTPLSVRRMPIAGVEFQGVLYTAGRVRATTTPTTTTPAVHNEDQSGRATTTTETAARRTEETVETSDDTTLTTRVPPPHKPVFRYLSAAALVTTHEALSETAIVQRSLMRDFFHSPLHASIVSNTPGVTNVLAAQKPYHVMAVKRPVGMPMRGGETNHASSSRSAISSATGSSSTLLGRDARVDATAGSRQKMLALAREKDILVYEKVSEGRYRFAV